MKYWRAASALLTGILLFLVIHGAVGASLLNRMISALDADPGDAAALRGAWDDAAGFLSWCVAGQELEDMEEDLLKLEKQETSDPAYALICARIRRRLDRIYDGFVPSFSGIF